VNIFPYDEKNQYRTFIGGDIMSDFWKLFWASFLLGLLLCSPVLVLVFIMI